MSGTARSLRQAARGAWRIVARSCALTAVLLVAVLISNPQVPAWADDPSSVSTSSTDQDASPSTDQAGSSASQDDASDNETTGETTSSADPAVNEGPVEASEAAVPRGRARHSRIAERDTQRRSRREARRDPSHTAADTGSAQAPEQAVVEHRSVGTVQPHTASVLSTVALRTTSNTSATVSLSPPVTATATAAVPDPPTTTRKSSVGVKLLTSVLSRLLSPRPADLGDSPLMWGVLAWARRSVDRRTSSGSDAVGSAVPTLALAAAPVTPAFVQVAAATPQTSQASVAVKYSLAQTAGDTNVVAIGWNNATSSITSVTDSAGNAYRLAAPTARGSGISQAIYYASGIKGAAAGTNTVTVVFNSATPYVDVRALEYSGLDSVNPFDRTASAAGTGTAASSGAVTTTAANELVFAAGTTTGAFLGAGTGFSSRIITTPDADIAQDRVAGTTGSYSATATLSGSAAWLMQVATFKAATATGTDTTAPTVSVTAPNGTVSGTVILSATANDNVAVAGVQFLVDNTAIGIEDTTSPYSTSLDTTTLVNGTHTLTALARDSSGNTALSAPVTITVGNAGQPGTFRNEILATGLNLPTAMKFLPDGRMLVAELGGTVKVLSAPYTQADPTPFLQITNIGTAGDATVEQQGIYDIALDPNYATNHYYYVSYTAKTPNRDRLSRFTANATSTGTVPGSELVIYQDTQDANAEHHGGAITFGNDGKVYFTTGDAFLGAPSQDLTSPRGKVLRFNTDGTIPTDNPFYDGSGPNYDAVWALGLRNPYRAYYDAPTGRLLIGDVGGNDPSTSMEELNLGVRGANYGWPNVEGNATNPAYTSPIYTYPHSGRDAAITGGFVYHGTQFPSSYQGSYFFADYAQNTIKRLTFDANGNVNGVFNVDPADGTPDGPTGDIVYLTQGPEGALYYIDIGVSDTTGTVGVSKIRRISYTGSANLPPVASASATPTSGATPLTVNFSSAGSSDPEGQTLTYAWDFGDQTSSTVANPTHTYNTAGSYQARLTVSDGVNSAIGAPLTVVAGNAPTVTILSPTDGLTFKAGDVITFSGSATDVEDGTLPATAYTWTFDFLHDTHVHPGSPITGVTSGTFTVPTSGHDWEDNTRYRVSLTVTDSTGLQTTKSVLIYPQKVNLTFNTGPSGAAIYVDGVAHTAPFVLNDLIGFTHTISAPDQTIGGNTYTFSSWSDGGAQSHTLVVPATAQTYSANFTVANPINPPGFVQVSAATPQTSQSSVAVKYTAAQTAGNTNVLAIGWNNATSSITSVTDSAGNAYQPAVPTARGAGVSQAIYYAPNIKAAAAGTNTVTVTFNTATPYVDVRALEYSGLDRANPFDVGASASGTGTTASTGAVNTTGSNDLLFAAGMTTGAFLGAGTGFSSRIITTPDADIAQDRLVSTAGSYSASAPLGASSVWLMQVAAFRATAVTDTTAPSVSVTAPSGTVSGTVTLSANASDNVAVTGVQFLVDNTAVGSQDTTSPYSTSWDTTTVANGTHTLTARATDTSGNTATSAPVTITVNNTAADTIAPTVSVTAPSGTVSGTVTLSANASDNVAVTGVQFLVDNTAVGSQDTTSPYSVTWNSTTVANGTHTISARATDSSGNTTLSAPVSVTVNNAVTAPPGFVQVSAVTPQTSQSSVAVKYTAAQTAGDTNVLAIGWNNATSTITSVTDSAGNTYRVAVPTARGTGVSQAIYYASNIKAAAAGTNTVTVVFNTATPYVDVRALEYSGLDPANPFGVGASASGTGNSAGAGSVTTTTANELIFTAGMTTGGFSAPGTGFTSRIITTPDLDIAQDRLAATAGTYSATASLSGTAAWLLQAATFKAASTSSADTTAPTVTVTTAGGTVSGTVSLGANASDNVAVAGVQFLIDNTAVGAQDTATPYSVSWNSTTVANGTHTITARATDTSGNATLSAPVTITVSNPGAPATTTSIFFEGSPSVGEASGTVMVPIGRSGDLTRTSTIEYGITPDTATAGVDYVGGSGTITMAAGVARVLIPVQIINDNISESTETFVISIINVDSGSTLLFPRTARINILDDENPVIDPVSPPLTSNYSVTEQYVISGLSQPVAFQFAPQNPSLLYVAEKDGLIKVFNVVTGAQQSTFVDIRSKVNNAQDRGLLDIALDPRFGQPVQQGQPEHNYVYAFYVVDPPGTAGNPAGTNAGPDGGGNRFAYVVRFTADAATNYTTAIPGSEVVLLGGAGVTLSDISGAGAIDSTSDTSLPESGFNSATGKYVDNYIKVDSRSHAGGSLAFGPDGALYVGIGDGTSFDLVDPRTRSVQNINSLSGKILRIDPTTGSGLPDNPFVKPGDDLNANHSKVFQLGLRNPFSIGFAQDGRLFISNTGWYSWEEIESGYAGANFGWPYYEGGDGGVVLPAPGYRDLPNDPARGLPSAADFYAAVASGAVTITPAYRAFAHDANEPGFQVGAIVGVDGVYTGSQYPAEFQNDIFFSDVNAGEVYVVDINNSDVRYLYGSQLVPVAFSQGPDGYIYAANLAGSITRLQIVPKQV